VWFHGHRRKLWFFFLLPYPTCKRFQGPNLAQILRVLGALFLGLKFTGKCSNQKSSFANFITPHVVLLGVYFILMLCFNFLWCGLVLFLALVQLCSFVFLFKFFFLISLCSTLCCSSLSCFASILIVNFDFSHFVVPSHALAFFWLVCLSLVAILWRLGGFQ